MTGGAAQGADFQALSGINPDWTICRAMAANLKPMAADLGRLPQ
jgi:hypothetical protein